MDSPFSLRFDRALRLAAIVHQTQERKGTRLPYISHPVHVARLLDRESHSEDVVIAGLLHDILEDGDLQDSDTRARLRAEFDEFASCADEPAAAGAALDRFVKAEFGSEVYRLVRSVTEQKADGDVKRPWRERKLEQLQHVRAAAPEVLGLKAADALHNVQSVLLDVRRLGADVFRRFNASPDASLWHYSAISAAVSDGLGPENRLARNLEAAVAEVRAQMDALLGPRDVFTGRRGVATEAPSGDPPFIVAGSDGASRIHSTKQWFRNASPARGESHWKAGRSALEAARAWCSSTDPAVPEELARLFDTHEATAGLELATVMCERETALDDLGPGRQHDLLAFGVARGRKVVVGIECKADEPFGDFIGECLDEDEAENLRRSSVGKRSTRRPERIAALSQYLFGRSPDHEIRGLRYQLLHGIVGTLMEAQRRSADIACFVVHEFRSDGTTTPAALERNDRDLAAMLTALASDNHSGAIDGRITGPFLASSFTHVDRPVLLYVGKTLRVVDA